MLNNNYEQDIDELKESIEYHKQQVQYFKDAFAEEENILAQRIQEYIDYVEYIGNHE